MRRLIFVAILLAVPQLLQAETITFEAFGDSTIVTNEIPGLSFTNATVLSAGISLNEFDYPPVSGSNVLFDDGGPITIEFSTQAVSVGAYFTYMVPITFTAFDSANNELGSAISVFSENYVSSGNPANELLQLAFGSPISKITISGDPAGYSFVMDDLTYSTGSTPVPEPGTLSLLALGGLSAFVLRRRIR